uniref:Uncharacterized protein n=1 Tax=Solanum tuberosum TaxID=4113 RepID=M1DB38_SOLTU
MTNKETLKGHLLATLLTQLELLTKRIMELEAPEKYKDRYIPPHEHIKSNVNEGGQIAEILCLILSKVKRHDIVLNEIKENVSMLNEITDSHFLPVQLLETRIGHVMSRLHPMNKD